MSGLEIVRVPVLSDNYAWLIHDTKTGEVAVVDPGEATPVLAAAKARDWTVSRSGRRTGIPITPAATRR